MSRQIRVQVLVLRSASVAQVFGVCLLANIGKTARASKELLRFKSHLKSPLYN